MSSRHPAETPHDFDAEMKASQERLNRLNHIRQSRGYGGKEDSSPPDHQGAKPKTKSGAHRNQT